MTKYAADTQVPAHRSRIEIEKTLTKYGADSFAHMTTPEAVAIEFYFRSRRIRLVVDMPTEKDRSVALTATGQRRSGDALKDALAKAERQRWRALLLLVKAKLEAVESGIVTFEDEFLAHTVLPSGHTVSQELQPQITTAYEEGAVRPLEITR